MERGNAAGRRPAVFGPRFARAVWRLMRIYWGTREARIAGALLAGAITLELATVFGNVLISDAERRIMDALQARQPAPFFGALGLFAAVMAVFVVVSTYRIYLRQLVEIRWRRGLTDWFLGRWISEQAQCQAMLHGQEIDNPDQRIAEDARDFVGSALGLSLSLLAAVATLVSFGGMLWRLSGKWALPVDSVRLQVPGFLLWVAVGYAVLSTWLTHVVGRPLVPINFDRLRVEADFRYGLMRFRDNVELVTLSHGESLERRSATGRFGSVVRNWWQMIAAQRNLNLLTTGIGQANGLVPLLVAAPGFFAGVITLGTIVQIRFAYGQVSGALNWLVFAYQEIARWRAGVERLSTFAVSMDQTAEHLTRSQLRLVEAPSRALRLRGVRLETADGATFVEAEDATVNPGDRVAITGPSGSGKTMLLRAIAGRWHFGRGTIAVPAGARMLFVPQWPYVPLGTLRAVLSYPASEGTYPDEAMQETLALLGLGRLGDRLDEIAPWDQQLSPHEQQRLGIARVLLYGPEWLFLDKATSALDEAVERRVYGLLFERLPHAAIVSVALTPAVAAYHARRWTMAPQDHGPAVLQVG